MIRREAERLTEICCKRNWIDEDARAWCAYALEKCIGLSLFFTAVLVWMVLSERYVETVAFLGPFYLIRRRMGGCHAKSACACFFISLGLVAFVSCFLGDWLMLLPLRLLLMLDCAVTAILLVLRPAYPPQVNFGEAEKKANNKRKNILLVALLLVQLVSVTFVNTRILSHSFCGLTLSAATIIIQKNILKRSA